ncbi:MAG: DUF2975 domain-containing protein [bacterium]|nr:DUF2975 domain-containing protein [bacterium]
MKLKKTKNSSKGATTVWVTKTILDVFLVITILITVLLGSTAVIFVFDKTNESFPKMVRSQKYEMVAGPELLKKIRTSGSGDYVTDTQVKLMGEVSYKIKNTWLKISNAAALLLLFGAIIFVLQLLRKLIDSLKAGTPFIKENARRLRWIGWTIIVFRLFLWAYNWIIEGLLDLRLMVAENPLISDVSDGDMIRFNPTSFSLIVVGLIVLAIAEVFKAGTEMKEEQELTI